MPALSTRTTPTPPALATPTTVFVDFAPALGAPRTPIVNATATATLPPTKRMPLRAIPCRIVHLLGSFDSLPEDTSGNDVRIAPRVRCCRSHDDAEPGPAHRVSRRPRARRRPGCPPRADGVRPADRAATCVPNMELAAP